MRTFFLSCVCLVVFAVSAGASKPIPAGQITSPQPLLPYSFWLADPDARETIDSITSGSSQQRFTPLTGGFPLKGEGPVWIRLVIIKNNGGADGDATQLEDARLSVNLGALPAGETYVFMSKAPGQLGDEGGWHAERVFPYEAIALPEPGLLPVSVYIRMDETPGLWFAPTISAKSTTQPDVLPSELMLPGLFIAACAACLLRAVAERAQWAFWAALFLLCALGQTLLPLPAPTQGFRSEHLPALLAPGMCLLLLPHIGRCMFRPSGLSAFQDKILFLCSLIGAGVALGPLLPGFSWLLKLFPLWPLLLFPLLPLCFKFLAAGRPGALAFTGICIMPLLGAGLALYALFTPEVNPLAAQGSLWGLAVGGVGLALARIPAHEKGGTADKGEAIPRPAGLVLAESAADEAKSHIFDKGLSLTQAPAFTRQSQYDELPPLHVMPLARSRRETPGNASPLPDLSMPDDTVSTVKNAGLPPLDSELALQALPGSPLEANGSSLAFDIFHQEDPHHIDSEPAAPEPASKEGAELPDASGMTESTLSTGPAFPESERSASFSEKSGRTSEDTGEDFRTKAHPVSGEKKDPREIPVLSITEEILSPEELAWFAKLGIAVSGEGANAPSSDPALPAVPGLTNNGSDATNRWSEQPGSIAGAASGPAAQTHGGHEEDAVSGPFGLSAFASPPESSTEAPLQGEPLNTASITPDAAEQTLEGAPTESGAAGYAPDCAVPEREKKKESVSLPLSPADEQLSSITEELREVKKEAARQSSFATDGGFLFNLHSLVREVHSIVAPLAQNRGLVFSWYISPLLPVLLEGDAPRLRSALILLLQNAVQASRKGAVQLAVRKNPGSEDPGSLLFVITDSGSAQRTEAGFFLAWEMAARSGGVFNVEYTPLGRTQTSFTVRFTLPQDQTTSEILDLVSLPQDDFSQNAEEDDIMPVLNTVFSPSMEEWSANAATNLDSFAEDLRMAGMTIEEVLSEQGFLEPAATETEPQPEKKVAAPGVAAPVSPTTNTPAREDVLPAPLPYADPVVERGGQNRAWQGLPRVVAAEMTTSNRRLLSHYLAALPHEHIQVLNNAKVPEIVDETPPSLIIFDGDTPESDIIRALTCLREKERTANLPPTPVLVLTSHQAQSRRLLENGATHALIKPVSQEEVRAVAAEAFAASAPALESVALDAVSATDASPQKTGSTRASLATDDAISAPAASSSQKTRVNSFTATEETATPDLYAQEREVDLLEAALRDAPAQQGEPLEVTLPPRHGVVSRLLEQTGNDKTREIPKAEASGPLQTSDSAGQTMPYGDAEAAAPMLLSLSPDDVIPAGTTPPLAAHPDGSREPAFAEADFEPIFSSAAWSGETSQAQGMSSENESLVNERENFVQNGFPDASGSLLDFVLPELPEGKDAFPGEEERPEANGEPETGGEPESGEHAEGPGDETMRQNDADPLPAGAYEQVENGAVPETGTHEAATASFEEDTEEEKEAAVAHEASGQLSSSTFFPLPGMNGEGLEAAVIPLTPGLIHALRDIMRDVDEAARREQSILAQEAAGRLAGKAENFGLVKLGKIARCVERAAEADDMEAVVTLLEDLGPVVARYIESLQKCFDSFLSLDR